MNISGQQTCCVGGADLHLFHFHLIEIYSTHLLSVPLCLFSLYMFESPRNRLYEMGGGDVGGRRAGKAWFQVELALTIS